MIAKYKTLAAAAALRRFTIADLVRYSGVKSTTVYSVLQRADRYIEPVEEMSTGKRGGRPKLYQVRSDHAEELLSMLRETEKGFDRGTSSISSDGKDELAAVAVAENALFRFADTADSADRARLVELARTSLRTAKPALTKPANEREPLAETLVEASLRFSAASILLAIVRSELKDDDDEYEKLDRNGVLAQAREAMLQLVPVASAALIGSYIQALTSTKLLQDVPLHEFLPLSRVVKVVLIDESASSTDPISPIAEKILAAFGEDKEAVQVVTADEFSGFPSKGPVRPEERTAAVSEGCLSILAYHGSRIHLRDRLRQIDTFCGALTPKVVVTQTFDPGLSDEASKRSADYVPMEGLSDDGVRGALSSTVPRSLQSHRLVDTNWWGHIHLDDATVGSRPLAAWE